MTGQQAVSGAVARLANNPAVTAATPNAASQAAWEDEGKPWEGDWSDGWENSPPFNNWTDA